MVVIPFEPTSTENQPSFSRDKKGKIYSADPDNITIALAALKVSVRYDKFADRMLITGLSEFNLLDDAALDRLWLLVKTSYGFLPTKEFFRTVVCDLARLNSFHPVKDYLDGLRWDKVQRLDTWLIDYASAKDTKYVRAVGAISLMAAVRRIRQPGCKYDELVIFESEQGKDKSIALAILAVKSEWFSDDLPLNADGKRVIEQTRGKWILEAAELSGMRKSEVDHLKSLLGRQVDRARLSFGRLTSEVPRQWVAFGTTNETVYLKDDTGNRRFWPVSVEFDIVKLQQDRDQLWAEAAERELDGESIRLKQELWAEAGAEQQERTVDDPWYDIVGNLLGDREGKLLAADAWTLVNLVQGQQTQTHNQRMGKVMRKLGWKRPESGLRFDGKVQSCYFKGDSGKGLERIFVYRDKDGISVTYNSRNGEETW